MKNLTLFIVCIVIVLAIFYFYRSFVKNANAPEGEQKQNSFLNLFNYQNENIENNTGNNNQNTKLPNYKGVYVATRWQLPARDYVFAPPYVDGIFYRLKWNEIEKSQGVYDWSLLNSEFERIKVANAGRLVPLKVSIGIATGAFAPEYLYDKGLPKLTFSQFRGNGTGKPFTFSMPTPWDILYTNAYNNLMISLKNELVKNNNYDLVSIIKLTGITQDTAEARLPAEKEMTKIYQGQTYTSTNAPQVWVDAGYTEEKLKNAWYSMGDNAFKLFKDKYISMAIIPLHAFPDVGAEQDVTYELMKVSQAKWKPNFIVQWNALNVSIGPKISTYLKTAVNNGSVFGLQLNQGDLGAPQCVINETACDETMFKTVMDTGLAYNMSFVEIFEQDVLAYPESLKYAHDILVK